MTSDDNKRLVRRWFEEAWYGGDLAVLDEVIGPEYVLHGAADPDLPPGPEGAKRLVAAFRAAFPDFHGTIEALIAEGDLVVCRWAAQGTHRGPFAGIAATHRPVTMTGIEIVRVAGGQIAEGWDEMDVLGVVQQLGAWPAPPPG
jgi:steroid delta-isomerase-like uncharacterized protein